LNPLLLNTENQEFINDNLNSDLTALILKGTSIEGIETKELIEQIESKKRSKNKLPTWFQHKNIYYPNKLNIEQTSSEITAEYKASFLTGSVIVDITGGFGVDSFYFTKRFKSVIHCEIDADLSQIVSHNFKQLEVENVQTIQTDGIDFLKTPDKYYDWIYIDPSRRHDIKGKVFLLSDCIPNVPEELEALFSHSNNIMIKTSPLLDISAGINDLKYVKTIHVVAIKNEVKELLWILEKGYHSEITIETINITPKINEVFNFIYSDELDLKINYSLPLNYLYEPNSAILKAGGFNSIAFKLDALKLHKHSHLYTSEELIDFPGRRFKISRIIPYHKKTIKSLEFQKANITTRNFPETVQQIRNTFKIKDGGTSYLFFTTIMNNEKVLLICSKVE